MTNLFISYRRTDSALAVRLCDFLTARGFKPWLDTSELSSTSEFRLQVKAALDNADFVLVLWTPASVSSHWVRAEAAYGMRRGRTVSIKIDNARVPSEFASSTFASVRFEKAKDPAREMQKIANAIDQADSAAFGNVDGRLGRINWPRVMDFGLTLVLLFIVWTLFMDAGLQLRQAKPEVIETPLPRSFSLVGGLLVTSFLAPLGFIGMVVCDYLARRLLKVGVAPSRRRVLVRWLGEGFGMMLPILVGVLVTQPPSFSAAQIGVGASIAMYLASPLMFTFVFALPLAPKYLMLLLSGPARRAVLR